MELSHPLGLSRDDAHRYFWVLDGATVELPSVTTVLRVVDKSGPLIGWAKRLTAEAAIDHRESIEEWLKIGGRDGAVSLLTKAATQERDKAANRGSDVHALAEAIARGQDVEVAPELAPLVDAYRRWLADWQPEFLAAEEMVASLTHGYAGTLDAIVRVAGETWLIDLKTSKGVYSETALQLAAYASADFFGRASIAKRYRIPAIDNYGVLHLTPTGYEVVPYDVTPETFEAFLAALRLYRWIDGAAKTVMGQPIGRVPAFQTPVKEAVA